MPIKFGEREKVKSGVDTYCIEKVLSQGAFAHAARARSSTRGSAVFLKRYFEPTLAAPWYQSFVYHQQELKRRITSHDGLRQYCYGFLDFFEGTEGRAKRTFHQVFEFIDGGKPLTEYIENLDKGDPKSRWEERVTFARVMMMAISALHEQRIVHTDLKPDNLLLIPNPLRPGSYSLKVIDMDWAIFSDRLAPWHGQSSYIGTPGYMSPEHLSQQIPTHASDVFTCGLMLSQLLCGYHPFTGQMSDATTFLKAIKAGDFKPFKIPNTIEKVTNIAFLEEIVNSALSPVANHRPTANDIKNALFGRGEAGETPPPRHDLPKAPPAAPRPNPAAVPDPKPVDTYVRGVELLLDGNPVLKIRIDTAVGREMLKPASPDAQFYESQQFKVHRPDGKYWALTPFPETPNETLVDGVRLTSTTQLREGMRIAVGNASKGVEKLPLIVRFM